MNHLEEAERLLDKAMGDVSNAQYKQDVLKESEIEALLAIGHELRRMNNIRKVELGIDEIPTNG